MSSKQLNKSKANNNYRYKVSVIIPCYNVLPWIDQCLESLVNQTLESIEIITVNDGSTDGTGNRLDEWQAKYPNKIKVIHKKNGGLASAREAGMQVSQGECIGFVDADDWVDISMYAILYKTLLLKKLDFIYAKTCLIDNDTQALTKTKFNLPKVIDLQNKNNISDLKKVVLNINGITGAIFLHKFLTTNNIQLSPYQGVFAGEMPFLFNCIFTAKNIGVFDKYFYYYRKNRIGQLTSKTDIRHFSVFQELDYIINNLITNNDKIFKKIFLIKQLTIHAALSTKVNNNLKARYIANAAYNIFNKHSILSIYKQSIYLTFVRNWRYLPFTVLLNIFFIFKKLPMPCDNNINHTEA